MYLKVVVVRFHEIEAVEVELIKSSPSVGVWIPLGIWFSHPFPFLAVEKRPHSGEEI